MTPITERQKTLIVNNITSACKNINKLNKTGYNFLYLAIVFIVHYDLSGFINHYECGNCLKDDILNNREANQWRNFRQGEKNYEYYMSKKDVYNRLTEAICK